MLIPIPVVFLKYGAKIREKSKFAPTFPAMGGPSARDEEEGAGAALDTDGGKVE